MRHDVSCASCPHPPSAVHIPLSLAPSQGGENAGDAALIGRSQARFLDLESFGGDITDGGSFGHEIGEILADRLFPSVAFVSCALFWRDVLALEILVRPP